MNNMSLKTRRHFSGSMEAWLRLCLGDKQVEQGVVGGIERFEQA
jgi:hypothetical protein